MLLTNRILTLILPACLLFTLGATNCLAQFGDNKNVDEKGPQLGENETVKWQVGLVVEAVGGPVGGLQAAITVPSDWPEQQVKLVDEKFSANVSKVTYRKLAGDIEQMVVFIPQIPAGGTAEALVTYEVTRHAFKAPTNPDAFVISKRPDRDARVFLSDSPLIEARQRDIRDKAKELEDDTITGWEQVRKLYDFVKTEISPDPVKLKGALATLRDGVGNREDQTNLFIALCRAQSIPARMVWVPSSYYAEFYLEDSTGKGYWIPCDFGEGDQFGTVKETRPVLQKGDNVRVPEKKEAMRFAAETVKGKAIAGGGQPNVRFVRRLMNADFQP